MLLAWAALAYAAGIACLLGTFAAETFAEQLVLRPLPDGRVSLLFEFELGVDADRRSGERIELDSRRLSPSALLRPLIQNDVAELHLSMVAGRWQQARWHDPLQVEAGGTGAEVRAYIRGEDGAVTRDKWMAVTNALAGLFCSSLGQITDAITSSSEDVYPPTSPLPPGPHTLLHAHLPTEGLCTENLTPFLKLLPTKGLSGLSALMRPHSLLSHAWHAMGVDVWLGDLPESGKRAGQDGKVVMWWEAVVDPIDWRGTGKRDFSISSIFHQLLPRNSPLASSSVIKLIKPSSGSRLFESIPANTTGAGLQGEQSIWLFDGAMAGKDLSFRWDEISFEHPQVIPPPPVSLTRVLTGVTQISGGFHTTISNNHPDVRQIIYVEELPWYIRLSMRKMDIRDTAGRLVNIDAVDYQPAIDRKRPTLLRIHLTLPPGSTIHIDLPFTKAFIKYSEHPPDASRGFDLPPAVLYVQPAPNAPLDERIRNRIYSSKLLVDVPIPDFSMPYNVIIMTCTLMALFFGSVFNPLVRRFGIVHVPLQGK